MPVGSSDVKFTTSENSSESTPVLRLNLKLNNSGSVVSSVTFSESRASPSVCGISSSSDTSLIAVAPITI